MGALKLQVPKPRFRRSRVQSRNRPAENRFVCRGWKPGVRPARPGGSRSLRHKPVNRQLRYVAGRTIKLGGQPGRRAASRVPVYRRAVPRARGAQCTTLHLQTLAAPICFCFYVTGVLRATRPLSNIRPADQPLHCSHRCAASRYPRLFRPLPVPVRTRC